MNTETREGVASTGLEAWQGGLAGGLLGGLVFGIVMSVMTPGVLEGAIPSLYGLSTPAGEIGWLLHMSHSAVLGVVFAAIAEVRSIDERLVTNLQNGVAGLVYGVVIWLIFAVVVMPIWLDAVGFDGAPGVPNIGVESLLGHALYGLVLGITYSVLSEGTYEDSPH